MSIGIGMEQMPCGEFEANAMYFSIGVLTHNLMIAQKYFVIRDGGKTLYCDIEMETGAGSGMDSWSCQENKTEDSHDSREV